MDRKLWCIIDADKTREPTIYERIPLNHEYLDDQYRPKCIYTNYQSAIDELLRLTKKYGEGFVLFESVSFFSKQNKSITDEAYLRLEEIKNDD